MTYENSIVTLKIRGNFEFAIEIEYAIYFSKLLF
jgi:hypothetical protein